MFKVLAQDGTTQLHLEGVNKYRTLRVSSTEPLEALAITLAVEDLPGIALGLLKGNPHLLTDPQLSAAVKTLSAYVGEQKLKKLKTKLATRRDAVATDIFADLPYDGLNVHAQEAVDRIIALEDKLEAAK